MSTQDSRMKDALRRDLTERIELALVAEKDDSFMEFKPSQVNILIEDIKELEAKVVDLEAENKTLTRINMTYHPDYKQVKELRSLLQELGEALEAIKHYGDQHHGCCPYGCDTPTIAKEALTKLNKFQQGLTRQSEKEK